MANKLHGKRRGWLNNGNTAVDLSKAKKFRVSGSAMRNGRRRMHGGKSTSPRTPEGLERSRKARWIHGAYSREIRELFRRNRQRWRESLRLLDQDAD
jgi:hypothetical protein